MAVLNTGLAKTSASGYTIDQSLRFNDDDSAYLSRTLGTNSSNRIKTFSCWFKLGNLGTQRVLTSTTSSGNIEARIEIASDDKIKYVERDSSSGTTDGLFISTQKLRDVSAFYHLLVSIDTTQSTASNRIKIYLNGVQITAWDTETIPSQNYDLMLMRSSAVNYIGKDSGSSGYFDGYQGEVNFIDGQALTPADFGETGDYGEWKPIEYEGTYGTNGFYLSFAGGGIIAATGGTITTDGDYKVHSFTSNGTFTPSAAGEVEYLVIAGGGGGGSYGGGGAGGYRTGYLAVLPKHILLL